MSKIEINYWRMSQYIERIQRVTYQLKSQLLDSYVTELHFINSKSRSSQYFIQIMTLLVRIAQNLILLIDTLVVKLNSMNELFQFAESKWVADLVK